MIKAGNKMETIALKEPKKSRLIFLSKKGVMLLLLAVPLLQSCNKYIISSPEGTTTNYMEDSGVLVYAPRAAKAQKVIFDTKERQLIHEPDTPFRKFFNSHKNDFADGQLDYAKTTILEGIVSRLRNKEYIRRMVQEVLSRHKKTAIKGKTGGTTANSKPGDPIRDRNVKLLEDAIYLALVRENYPFNRDEDIERIIEKFVCTPASIPTPSLQRCPQNSIEKQFGKIWRLTVKKTTGTTNKTKDAVETFVLDLKQTLREREFFKTIIAETVSKRLNLFRSGGLPVEPMQKAKTTLERFLNKNLVDDEYGQLFAEGKESLWSAFVQNKLKTTLLPSVNKDDFARQLHSELTSKYKKNNNLQEVFDELLKTKKAMLMHEGNATDIVNSIKNTMSISQELITSYKSLKAISDKFDKEFKDKAKDAEVETEKAKNNLLLKITTAKNQINNSKAHKELLKKGHNTLKKLLANTTYPPTSTPITCDGSSREVISCIALLDQKMKDLVVLVNEKNPGSLTWDLSEFNNVLEKKRDLRNKLNNLSLDEAFYRNLDLAFTTISSFSDGDDYSDLFSAIEVVTSINDNIKTKYPNVNISSENLKNQIVNNYLAAVQQKLGAITTTPQDTFASRKEEVAELKRVITNIAAKSTSDLGSGANGDFSPALVALKDTQFTQEFAGINDLHTSYTIKEQLIKSRQKSENAFVIVVEKGFDQAYSILPTDQLLLDSQFKQLKVLVSNGARTNANPNNKLNIALPPALPKFFEKISIASIRDTSGTRAALVAALTRLFNGYESLLSSDEPIFVAVLDSEKVKFSDQTLKKQALIKIPKMFAAKLSTDKNFSIKNLVTVIDNTFSNLDIAYLFGTGNVNNDVIGAFSTEFYQAFRHRLIEAVEAEQKAGYDYWWLTFYPKAIPLGDKTVEGQSLIEVNFGDSLVPKEQYHRWLQDTPLTAENSEQSGLNEYERKVRLATSVITDFMLVLDSSELGDKYPLMRPSLLEALTSFTAPLENKLKDDEWKKKYYRGLGYLYKTANNNRQGVIAQQTGSFKTITDLANSAMEDLERANTILKSVCNSGDKCKKGNTLALKKHEIDTASKYLGSLKTKIEGFKGPTESSIKAIKDAKLTLEICDNSKIANAEQCTNFNNAIKNAIFSVRKIIAEGNQLIDEAYTKDAIDPYMVLLKTDLDNHDNGDFVVLDDISKIRNLLAREYFDLRHVLFSVLMASERHIALPQKIELLANAVFDGSRRFTLSPTPHEISTETKALKDLTGPYNNKKYLVTFDTTRDFNVFKGYLYNKGIESTDVQSLATRFKDLLDSKTASTEATTNECKTINENDCANEKAKMSASEKAAKTLAIEAVNKCKGTDSIKLDSSNLLMENLKQLANCPRVGKIDMIRYLFWDIKYRETAKTSNYLQHPQLWPWELKLDQSREELRELIVNLFHTSYPGVPDAERLKTEFMAKNGHLEAIIYHWLRDLWLYIEDNKLHCDGKTACEDKDRAFNTSNDKIVKVLIQHFLDKHQYLTRDSRLVILESLLKSNNISDWMKSIFETQHVMDQLSANLLDQLYQPLFDSLARLTKLERHPIPYKYIERQDFDNFMHWSKPREQKNILIVEMLPASRDDLVSMSVNEGGVAAKIAGKADAAASYDVNKLATFRKTMEHLKQELNKSAGSDKADQITTLEDLSKNFNERQKMAKNEKFEELLNMTQSGRMEGYSLGASAKGSIYARAKAAYAYSRRREYLDAAITAAGKGDNFAKWVVRKSDIRSSLAKSGASNKLVAAAHNGYPNGDQPFNLLVKIPHKAVHTDWDGSQYILFNSSYVATKRFSWWKEIGTLGFAAQLPMYLINWHMPQRIEESVVGTVFPFKWNIHQKEDQPNLLREPNILGGAIILDDTDKIKYSEVTALIEAENNFINTTRQVQNGEVSQVLNDIGAESGEFRNQINKAIKANIESLQSTQDAQRKAEQTAEKKVSLQSQIDNLENRLKELEAAPN